MVFGPSPSPPWSLPRLDLLFLSSHLRSSRTFTTLTMASTQSTSTLHVGSILKTLSTAAPVGAAQTDRQQAARQLAGLDPKRFLANLQAAVNRSPQAIVALKADMYELESIFYKLSRAGHDVSAAQRDFLMLKQFVAQLAAVEQRRPPPLPLPSSSTTSRSQRPAQHHRSSSLPTPGPVSKEQYATRPFGSYQGSERRYKAKDSPPTSSRSYHPDARYAHPPTAQGFTQGSSGASFAPSSTSSSSTSSSSSASRYSPTVNVLSPIPSRLVKSRRMSAPAVVPCAKKVHFASHATVYTYRLPGASGRDVDEPSSRPSYVPRAEGFFAPDGRPRF